MKYVYSPSNNLFYVNEWEGDYGDSWPSDCVNVTEAAFMEFTSVAPAGKVRVSSDSGIPAWADAQPMTRDEQLLSFEAQRQLLIVRANEYMNVKQWPGKAAIGRLKGSELAQYNLWLDYLDALEALDISALPDLNWPIKPE